MKTTIRAVLTDVTEELNVTLTQMMLIFCSALRFSFKRLLESVKPNDLEKSVAAKYGLNIRQAKDAVEGARQTIASQKELVKMYYEDYTKKVKVIETLLAKKDLSKRKRESLHKKLEKRKKKQKYYKDFIDAGTIPSVVFGTKKLFIERCKGRITKEEWQAARNNRIYSRGDKTKMGNPNLRIIQDSDGQTYLEISTLQKTKTNRAVKLCTPIYLPQKLSKKTGMVNGRDYRQMFLDYLKTGEAYQVEMIKKDGKYYCHITFDEAKVMDYKPLCTSHFCMMGVDTNPDGFGITLISRDGNYKESIYLKQPELQYARSNRRENLCGELAKQVVSIAQKNECGVAIEDLKFRNDRDVGRKFSRIKHQFIYKTLLTMLETACIRAGIEVTKVKPQYTSKIGLYKYCHQYGLDIHNAAAMVIARRAYGYIEKVPKILKDKLIFYRFSFEKKTEWGQWATINKKINGILEKLKGGTGFCMRNRKQVLGLEKS
jgi:IS605 OrfB family transposase